MPFDGQLFVSLFNVDFSAVLCKPQHLIVTPLRHQSNMKKQNEILSYQLLSRTFQFRSHLDLNINSSFKSRLKIYFKSLYQFIIEMMSHRKQILTKDQIQDYKFRYRQSRKSYTQIEDGYQYNPQQSTERSMNFKRNNDSSVGTLKKNRPYKIYTTMQNYAEDDEYYHPLVNDEDQDDKKNTYMLKRSKIRLPEIKTIRYVVKKNVESDAKKERLLFNFMNPTVNSLINAKKTTNKNKNRIDAYKKLCSVDCIDRSRVNSKVKLKPIPKKQFDPWVQRIYYPTLRQYLYKDKPVVIDLVRDEEQNEPMSKSRKSRKYIKPTLYFDQKYEQYQLIESQKLNFSNIQTNYARKIFDKEITQILPQTVFKNELIPRIPQKHELSDFINNYSPKNEQINMAQLMKSPYFIVEWSPDEVYFGEMIGKDKSGRGIWIQEKRVFEGLFRNNNKVKGVESNDNGIYRGQYYMEKREGNGEFEWYNGQYYLGEWKAGKRNGNGLWVNRAGDSYNGTWKNGKGDGYGVYVVKDSKYKGEFLNFLKHGWGRQSFSNGDTFEGNFKEGLPHGKGTYYWADGTIYEGQFIGGLREGKGILKTNFQLTYTGMYAQQRPDGLCEITMPNGDVYKGMFKNGRKNGRGMLIMQKSKRILDGFWQDDKFVEQAIY